MPPPELIAIYWRDIPAQVIARDGPFRADALLDGRFQSAIDRAATVAGLESTDDYLEQWRRNSEPCTEDLRGEADRAVNRINARFSEAVVATYVRNGGLRPDSTNELKPGARI